jgi:hypothetical protein
VWRGWPAIALVFLSIAPFLPASGQVIEFHSNGLDYQALTRDGLTLMFAPLPLTVREFSVVQVSFSNGSDRNRLVQPTDFFFESSDGRTIQAYSEERVIQELYQKAGRQEVMKLQSAYEKALYDNRQIRSKSGYEARRQSAMARGPKGLKAAAAAAAISFVRTELSPGDSTDGAIFFANDGSELGAGSLVVRLQDGAVYRFLSR